MSTSTRIDELTNAWNRWHAAREQDLATEHGWLSLTGFHWLATVPRALDGIPGRWHVQNERAVLEANGSAGLTLATSPEFTQVDGKVIASVPEGGSLNWVRYGDVLVELVQRGGRYAIRIRDPKAPERAAFSGVPSFPVDSSWVRPGRFVRFAAPRYITVDTARGDLRQQVTAVGTVEIDFNGERFSLVATADQGGRLKLAFTDATNGAATAPWRVVTTSHPTETGSLVVDFNRAINLPFAFTEFGTCPAPVTGNALPVAVTAGEKAPIRVTGSALVAS